jgi:paired amphipathic helix protein Sin3a
LEILQTYQKEARPIQNVYAQVTQLFSSAPDLLEDFKQFLPESAATKAKTAEGAKGTPEETSNVRGDPVYLSGVQPFQGPQPTAAAATATTPSRMPTIGNFAPPPSQSSVNAKKRQRTAGTAVPAPTPAQVVSDQTVSQAQKGVGVLQPNKKPRLGQGRIAQPETLSVSPTLTPALPEPLPPSSNEIATAEESQFFEKVKKYVSNKQTYSEFLKLCNLFAQDLIDKNILVARASCFISGNTELMNWFKKFVGYDGRDEVIENVPRNNGKVALSNCRGLGPSYRLLPKSEQLQVCSGRDELCDSVLNDEWASHPTWASEESGFQAHRKNSYEELLHRIEEERHDYDFNIESLQRVIQLLEPIAQRLAVMSQEEMETFTLQPGLGGQSIAIPNRVIKKIYGREVGNDIMKNLYANPSGVIPVVLKRLRERDLTWQTSRRAWESVWRDQVNRVFWKSLDHQGINAKTADKKLFLTKTLQQEITVVKQEQKRQRAVNPSAKVERFQFKYSFDDSAVIMDSARLIAIYADHTVQFNAGDRQKIDVFIKAFIPLFFGLSLKEMEEGTGQTSGQTPSEDAYDAGETLLSKTKSVNRKTDMLRSVLDRSRMVKQPRRDKEDSGTPGSKETTPEAGSSAGDENQVDSVNASDLSGEKWTRGAKSGSELALTEGAVSMKEPFERTEYSLYGNNTIYTFFRLFQILYSRLSQFKEREDTVAVDLRQRNEVKPANELKLIDKSPAYYFKDSSEGVSYYGQVLQMCEDLVSNNMDSAHFEDALRMAYIDVGWELYSIEKLLTGICRMAHFIVSSDSKDKSNDMIHLFMKDRNQPNTTFADEIDYRRAVEKLSKDEVYRIGYVSSLLHMDIS